MKTLETLRAEMDQIDQQIVQLLNQRMSVAQQVAKCKDSSGSGLADLNREHEILKEVWEQSQDVVLKDQIVKIYQEIMDCSKLARRFQQTPEMTFQKIGIIGCGLIGGSIAKALRAKDAKTQLYLADKTDSIALVLKHAEVVIIATPISEVIPIAEKIKASLSERGGSPLLVLDVASVKSAIVARFAELSSPLVEFVATHPMAGSEKNGEKWSRATLFIGAPWIIVPHANNTQEHLARAAQWIEYLGATAQFLTKEEHDFKAGLISHMPRLLAQALWDFVQLKDAASLEMAGPGFRSMTRLANQHPQLYREIMQYNESNIQKLWEEWTQFLSPRTSKGDESCTS